MYSRLIGCLQITQGAPIPIYPHRDWFDYAMIIATLALAATSCWIGWNSNRQSQLLRSSTDAVIAAERAWVMVVIESPLRIIYGLPTGRGVYQGETTAVMSYRFENQGKTPAWITSVHAALLVGDPGSLPQGPDLKAMKAAAPVQRALGAGGSDKAFAQLMVTANLDGHWETHNLTLIGVVKYRLMFSLGEMQTTFAYRFSSNDHIRRLTAEFPKYNQNT